MNTFLIISLAILLIIVITIASMILSKKKKQETTSPPTTAPPCTKYKYKNECLDSCGAKYVDENKKTCYDEVPEGKFIYGNIILDEVPSGKYVYDGRIIYDLEDIPEGKFIYGNIILDEVPSGKYVYDGRIIYDLEDIPEGKFIYGNIILDEVPSGKYVYDERIIYDFNDIPEGKFIYGNIILDNVPSGKYVYDGRIIYDLEDIPSDKFIYGNIILDNVPSGKYVYDGRIIYDLEDIPEGKFIYGNIILDNVPSGKYVYDGRIIYDLEDIPEDKFIYGNIILDEVPAGKYAYGSIIYDLEDIPEDKFIYGNIILDEVPAGKYAYGSIIYDLEDIPEDKFIYGNIILDNVPSGKYVYDGRVIYDNIPFGKYADGYVILDNCKDSIENKISYEDKCINSCIDKYLYNNGSGYTECKDACNSFYINDKFKYIDNLNSNKYCLELNSSADYFDMTYIKLVDNLNYYFDYDSTSYVKGKLVSGSKEILVLPESKLNNGSLIVSDSGNTYAAVTSNGFYIYNSDVFDNQPSVKFTYILSSRGYNGYTLETFEFIDDSNIFATIRNGNNIIILHFRISDNGNALIEYYNTSYILDTTDRYYTISNNKLIKKENIFTVDRVYTIAKYEYYEFFIAKNKDSINTYIEHIIYKINVTQLRPDLKSDILIESKTDHILDFISEPFNCKITSDLIYLYSNNNSRYLFNLYSRTNDVYSNLESRLIDNVDYIIPSLSVSKNLGSVVTILVPGSTLTETYSTVSQNIIYSIVLEQGKVYLYRILFTPTSLNPISSNLTEVTTYNSNTNNISVELSATSNGSKVLIGITDLSITQSPKKQLYVYDNNTGSIELLFSFFY